MALTLQQEHQHSDHGSGGGVVVDAPLRRHAVVVAAGGGTLPDLGLIHHRRCSTTTHSSLLVPPPTTTVSLPTSDDAQDAAIDGQRLLNLIAEKTTCAISRLQQSRQTQAAPPDAPLLSGTDAESESVQVHDQAVPEEPLSSLALLAVHVVARLISNRVKSNTLFHPSTPSLPMASHMTNLRRFASLALSKNSKPSTHHILMHALLIVHRLVALPVEFLPPSLSSPTRLLLAGLSLAESQLSDSQTTAKIWSRAAGISTFLPNFAAIKRDALEYLCWNVGVREDEYAAWVRAVRTCFPAHFRHATPTAPAAAVANNNDITTAASTVNVINGNICNNNAVAAKVSGEHLLSIIGKILGRSRSISPASSTSSNSSSHSSSSSSSVARSSTMSANTTNGSRILKQRSTNIFSSPKRSARVHVRARTCGSLKATRSQSTTATSATVIDVDV